MERKGVIRMVKLRGYFGLGLSLALVLSMMTGTTRAEFITMTLTDTAGSIPVDIFATTGPILYNVDASGLAALNGFLSATGSEYQLFSLGGSSNFPGSLTQGNLVLTGEVHSVFGGGTDSFLQITESESGFTSPTGPNGVLMSSSTGNFTNQPAGGGHTASSMFNTTTTPTYSVLSSGVTPNPEGGLGSVGVSPVSTLYTLTNTITFGLSPSAGNDIIDSFGVTATLSAVPEPASGLLLALGVPVVALGAMLRRRASAASNL
jgi:hypothetical protein